ncbi:MAG: P-loop NTPase [Planctomycetaceae bacterium]|nr:P-loop NTPase [Planctomycetaceae bacterium]
MTQDRALLPGDLAAAHSTALMGNDALEESGMEWGLAEPMTPAGPDLMIYVHALRRRWLAALGIGLACAVVLAVAVYVAVGDKYTAVAYLRVAISEAQMFGGNSAIADPVRFDIYKNTQEQLLLSRYVLMAALRKPEVYKIPAVKEVQRNGDPIEWLMKRISVSFPGRAEVMAVSVTRDRPEEALTLVKAVVDSYLTEVVNVERDQKRVRVTELETVCAAKDQNIRRLRQEMRNIGEQAGGTETDVLTTKHKLLLEDYNLINAQFARKKEDIARLNSELAGLRALLQNVDQTEVNPVELEMMLNNDQMARDLAMELGLKRMDQVYTSGTAKPGTKNAYINRQADHVKVLEERYETIKEAMRQKLRGKERNQIGEKILQLETTLKTMTVGLDETANKIAENRRSAEKIGTSTVELEMLRSDLKRETLQAADMSNEKEKLKVELRSPPRISQFAEAELPLVPSNATMRIGLTLLSVLAGLCCPGALLMLWDVRTQRINTTEDVSKKLRVPVLGSVPRIPSRVIRRLESPSKRCQSWHLRLTESVDGIAARLLVKADARRCRVIMVSSATAGEGKTTLASQLALSLARTGRRTLLMDFDLRRPSFDEVFGLPLSPGVSELLREPGPTADCVHPTTTDNLFVMTAGHWDRQALAALSNGAATATFKQLREEFSFVVIDTSPILPVADARFVSQLADEVVLSVFRDLSEAPKIQATCEILAAFGVQSVEAVVTGSDDYTYNTQRGVEATVTA